MKFVVLCDACDKPIVDSLEGFILTGAIYHASTGYQNTVPILDAGKEEVALCKACFKVKLGGLPKPADNKDGKQ